MSNETTTEATETKRLTIEDPVSPEDLARFSELQRARAQVADRVLELEEEKVRTLRAAANINNERQRLFEKVLIERGLPPTAPVEIEAATGKINLVEGAAPRTPAAEQAQAEAPADPKAA